MRHGDFIIGFDGTGAVCIKYTAQADHPVGMKFRGPQGAHTGRANHGYALREQYKNFFMTDRCGVVEETIYYDDNITSGHSELQEIPVLDRRMSHRPRKYFGNFA